jgi:sugar phosphate permease
MINQQRKWIIFAVLASGFVFSYFIRLSTGVIGPALMEDLQIDAAQLGLLAGAFFYAFAILQLPVGFALDILSPRRVILATLLLGMAGCVISALATDFCTALSGRILIGLGMSSVLMGSLKIFSYWFRQDQFAFLSGVMLSLGNFGALVAATPLVLASMMIGWRNCFLLFSLFLAVLSVAIFFLVNDSPEKSPATSLHSQETGNSGLTNRMLISLKTVFSNRHFWFISVSAFIRYGSLISVQGFLGTLYLIEVMGYSVEKAANILGMISIGYLIGSPLMGKMSDSVFKSRKKVMLSGLFIYLCVMLFFLLDIKSDVLWYAIFWGLGFFASIGAVSFAHVKELFPKEISGVVLTANNLFNIVGVAIGQHVMGFIISRYPKTLSGYAAEAYHSAFAVLSISCIIGFILYLFVRDTVPSSTGQV